MKLRYGIFKCDNSLIMMTYYNRGKLIPETLSCKIQCELYIDSNNMVRIDNNANISIKFSEKIDTETLCEMFHEGIITYLSNAFKSIFSGLKLSNFDGSNFKIDENLGGRRFYSKERNSELVIVGLDNYSIWSPTEYLFTTDNDYKEIDEDKLIPIWRDLKNIPSSQLELAF